MSDDAQAIQLAVIIREEIVRQYRDDERGKCPAGAAYYEENISPWLIARRILETRNGSITAHSG
jgi:hypothetical protein